MQLLHGQKDEQEQVSHQLKGTQQAGPDLLSSPRLPTGSRD